MYVYDIILSTTDSNKNLLPPIKTEFVTHGTMRSNGV